MLADVLQADRDWYNQEEGGIVDESHNPFVGDESKFEQREVELQKKLVPFLPFRLSRKFLTDPMSCIFLQD